MRVYVAGRSSDVERVRRVQRMFTDRGWTVSFRLDRRRGRDQEHLARSTT
jgi:hypothetical protein